MDYAQVIAQAKGQMGPCKSCPVCNGLACRNQVPGPGAKGQVGDVAVRNYQKWQDIRLNMDTLTENKPVDTAWELFGRRFRYPFLAAPIGGMQLHYGDKYTDLAYNDILVPACARAGIAAFTGDGVDEKIHQGAVAAIAAAGGAGVPTIKPWDMDTIRAKLDLARTAGIPAVAMDIDAAGLPFLKAIGGNAGGKSVAELRQLTEYAGVPFILKGIMSAKTARKALEAGAAGIVVSNHGGRVLDQCPATAEVLEEIAAEVKGKLTILVDGGIRSGVDIFKALALGADGVLIGRPFVAAVYGAQAEGVSALVDKLGAELSDTMAMCGAHSLSEITRDMVRVLR